MTYYVLSRASEQAESAGHASVAHIPFLLRSDGYYPAEANRYLRARALCEWNLRLSSDSPPNASSRRFLTQPSCLAMARRVACFLRWIEGTGRDWRTANYREDVLAWQGGLRNGSASESGRPLKAATISNLVGEACYFLTWAAEVPKIDNNHAREAFLVPTTIAKVTTSSGRRAKAHQERREVERRVGAIKRRPSQLHIPGPAEVGRWMRAMRMRFPVKSLMAELILETGIRITECNQMQVDTLPPRTKWERLARAGKLPVTITHGIKGPKVTADSMEAVEPREILVPLDIADRIDHYRSITRLNQIRLWTRAGETKQERDRRARATKPSRLWLSESTHQPFANVQFYRAWTNTPYCPEDWHPHKGREYFAVETIVDWIRTDLKARGSSDIPELSWLQGAMRDQVRLLLSPLMGHVSDETTMIYLRAVHLRLAQEFGHPALSWQAVCDQGEDDG